MRFVVCSSSGKLQFDSGTYIRYDAVTKTLHIESKVGKNFRSFLSTASGYATVGLKNGKPFIEVKNGEIEVKEIIVK